jgi:hypothetical protein
LFLLSFTVTFTSFISTFSLGLAIVTAMSGFDRLQDMLGFRILTFTDKLESKSPLLNIPNVAMLMLISLFHHFPACELAFARADSRYCICCYDIARSSYTTGN